MLRGWAPQVPWVPTSNGLCFIGGREGGDPGRGGEFLKTKILAMELAPESKAPESRLTLPVPVFLVG